MDKMVSLTIGVGPDPVEWRMLFNELSLQAARLGSQYEYVNVSSSHIESEPDTDVTEEFDQGTYQLLRYDDNTLTKVHVALTRALEAHRLYTPEIVLNCINEMKNAGILFRERA